MNFLSRLHSLFLPAIGIFLLTSLFPVVHAQQMFDQEFSAAVMVKVNAKKKNNESLIISYINRELRSLGDVRIVEENADWELRISCMSSVYASSVILNVVILTPFDITNDIMFEILPGEYKDLCIEATSNLHYFVDAVVIESSQELRNICEKIVTYFDSNYLNKLRKMHREWQERLRNKSSTKLP